MVGVVRCVCYGGGKVWLVVEVGRGVTDWGCEYLCYSVFCTLYMG